MTWDLFATIDYRRQHTESEFNTLVARELALMKGERLFTDTEYSVPLNWRGKNGFENYLKECPALLTSPHWRLAKRNPRLGLSKDNCSPCLHPKYIGEVLVEVRYAVDRSESPEDACSKLTNKGVPCPSGGSWTPLFLTEYCRARNIKRKVTAW